MDTLDTEEIAPSRGLVTETREFVSAPDGNTIQVLLIRPDVTDPQPDVIYSLLVRSPHETAERQAIRPATKRAACVRLEREARTGTTLRSRSGIGGASASCARDEM